jgi:hypothetical protein
MQIGSSPLPGIDQQSLGLGITQSWEFGSAESKGQNGTLDRGYADSSISVWPYLGGIGCHRFGVSARQRTRARNLEEWF